jgi:serine/threonine-protein kinase
MARFGPADGLNAESSSDDSSARARPRGGSDLPSGILGPDAPDVPDAPDELRALDDVGDWDEVFDPSVPALPPAPQVGERLGAFLLTERLGEGGMGTVFRAEHQLIGREVAIKVLLPEFAREREVVERFFREAQAVNLIHHPNIVDVSDFVDSEEHPPYLVMELLEGESLAGYLRRCGPMEPHRAIAIAMQICDAMEAVHARRIVHRDLKPDNVIVAEQPDGTLQVKLLDFGIAKILQADSQLVRTATGVPIGTPEYMAPEQIRGVDVDPRADLYAMGAILYELLTGHPPFGGQLGEILLQHLEAAPVPPSQRRDVPGMAPIPKALEEAVLHCLAKDPGDRIQTMKQLGELLDWADESELSSVVVIRDPAALQRRRWPWLMGAGVAAAAVALGFVLLGGDPEVETDVDATRASASQASAARRAAARRAETARAPSRAAPRPDARRPVVPADHRVQVVTRPPGAALFRQSDGHYLDHAPAAVAVPKGQPLTLLVRLRGHEKQSITLTDQSPARLTVELRRLGEAGSSGREAGSSAGDPSARAGSRPGAARGEARPTSGPGLDAKAHRRAKQRQRRRRQARSRQRDRPRRRARPRQRSRSPRRAAPRRAPRPSFSRDSTVNPFQ